MPRADKVAVVEEVRDKLRAADAAVLTEYRGLTVTDLAQLRGRAAPGQHRVQGVQEHPRPPGRRGGRPRRLLAAPRGAGRDRLRADGDAVTAAKALRDFGQDQPEPRRQGRPARAPRPEPRRGRGAGRRSNPARCSWPASPAASRPRWRRPPACSRPSPATSPTASRPTSTNGSRPARRSPSPSPSPSLAPEPAGEATPETAEAASTPEPDPDPEPETSPRRPHPSPNRRPLRRPRKRSPTAPRPKQEGDS